MKTFSYMDKHYDRHNECICTVCGCTTERWKSVCDSCRHEAVQELIKKEELKAKEEKGINITFTEEAVKVEEEYND